jgi:hypothetical protein
VYADEPSGSDDFLVQRDSPVAESAMKVMKNAYGR